MLEGPSNLIRKDEIRVIPKRKLSEADKQIIMLKLERMRLEREKSLLILGSSIILFLAFITISVIGVLNDIIEKEQLNILIFVALVCLLVGISPYVRFVIKEEKSLKNTLDELIN